MKLAAWDIEIAKDLPEGEVDWKAHRPLGISCASVALETEDGLEIHTWHEPGQMSRAQCRVMVHELNDIVHYRGYTLVTWAGASFDWGVLAEESALPQTCADLCLNHVDLMFIVVAIKGHYLALDTACRGMGVQGKLKEVTLSDGTVLQDMSGARAPQLWAQGEYQAVLDYLADDVRSTLELAQRVAQWRSIQWTARSGRRNVIDFAKLYTVRECLDIPEPDTSWMSHPPRREDMVSWMNLEGQLD